jgi:hypothetical protein
VSQPEHLPFGQLPASLAHFVIRTAFVCARSARRTVSGGSTSSTTRQVEGKIAEVGQHQLRLYLVAQVEGTRPTRHDRTFVLGRVVFASLHRQQGAGTLTRPGCCAALKMPMERASPCRPRFGQSGRRRRQVPVFVGMLPHSWVSRTAKGGPEGACSSCVAQTGRVRPGPARRAQPVGPAPGVDHGSGLRSSTRAHRTRGRARAARRTPRLPRHPERAASGSDRSRVGSASWSSVTTAATPSVHN